MNYICGAYLQGAVDSQARQTCPSFELFIVDNASTDTSFKALDTSAIADVTLMAETENHGFARCNNLAAARARGDWIVLMNSDAEAAPDWLDQIEQSITR